MRAQSGACALDFREAETPEPITQKPARKRRVCMPAEAGENLEWHRELLLPRRFSQAPILPRAKCAPDKALPGGLRCNSGGPFALNFRRSAGLLQPAPLRALACVAR